MEEGKKNRGDKDIRKREKGKKMHEEKCEGSWDDR